MGTRSKIALFDRLVSRLFLWVFCATQMQFSEKIKIMDFPHPGLLARILVLDQEKLFYFCFWFLHQSICLEILTLTCNF